MKKTRNRKVQHSYKQPEGYSHGFIPVDHFSFKIFFINILIGFIGIIGIWYFTPAFEAISAGDSLEPLKIAAFLLSVVLVMATLFGIYDWLCNLLEF